METVNQFPQIRKTSLVTSGIFYLYFLVVQRRGSNFGLSDREKASLFSLGEGGKANKKEGPKGCSKGHVADKSIMVYITQKGYRTKMGFPSVLRKGAR